MSLLPYVRTPRALLPATDQIAGTTSVNGDFIKFITVICASIA
jgi:hypothetical protein